MHTLPLLIYKMPYKHALRSSLIGICHVYTAMTIQSAPTAACLRESESACGHILLVAVQYLLVEADTILLQPTSDTE